MTANQKQEMRQQLFDKALFGVRGQGGGCFDVEERPRFQYGDRKCNVGYTLPHAVLGAQMDYGRASDACSPMARFLSTIMPGKEFAKFVNTLARAHDHANIPQRVDGIIQLDRIAADGDAGFLSRYELAMQQLAEEYKLTYTPVE